MDLILRDLAAECPYRSGMEKSAFYSVNQRQMQVHQTCKVIGIRVEDVIPFVSTSIGSYVAWRLKIARANLPGLALLCATLAIAS